MELDCRLAVELLHRLLSMKGGERNSGFQSNTTSHAWNATSLPGGSAPTRPCRIKGRERKRGVLKHERNMW